MIFDNYLTQRDAESLLVDAVVNFKCGQFEQNFIKQFIISALAQ